MAVLLHKNGTWYCQYRMTGKKSPIKEYFGPGPGGKKQAEIRDAEIKLQKAKGQALRESSRIYLDQLAQEHLRHAKQEGKSEKWRAEYAHLLNKFILPHLCKRPVEQLEWSDILDLVEKVWPSNKPTSISRYLGYLKATMRYGLEQGYISRHPLERWKKPKEGKKHFELTVEDLWRIMDHAEPHCAWAMRVTWETWVRPGESELFAMRYDGVDFKELTIHVPGTKTLSSNRWVPITPEFAEEIRIHQRTAQTPFLIEFKGLPIRKLRRAPETAARRAGIQYDFCMYDIRHLGASDALRNGADLAAVSAILGHADIETTQRRYYHVMKNEKRRAIESRTQRPQKAGKVVRIR